MKLGIVQDGKLILTTDRKQYGGETEKQVTVTEKVYDDKLKKEIETTKTETAKPVQFAAIPKFNQETQAVYQGAPVDKGDVIEVGVRVVDVPEEEMVAEKM